MPRGRPSFSVVRERLKEILYIAKKLTAYDAHKHYIELYAKTSQRNVYYQLQKGEAMGEFKKTIVDEPGEYSWGPLSRKVYFELAKPDGVKLNPRIRTYFEKKGELK